MAAFLLTMAELSTYNRGLWSAKLQITILRAFTERVMDPCPSGRVEETKAGRLLHQLPPYVPCVQLCPLHFALHIASRMSLQICKSGQATICLKSFKDFLLGQTPKSFTGATKLRHLSPLYPLVYTPASLVYFLLCFAFSIWVCCYFVLNPHPQFTLPSI